MVRIIWIFAFAGTITSSVSSVLHRPHNLEWLFHANNRSITEQPQLERSLCSTEQCEKLAKMIIDGMNRNVNPCDDFYEFACGNWKTHNPLPPHEKIWSPITKIERNVDERLKEIVTSDPKPEDSHALRFCKRAYKACMDTDEMDRAGLQPLVSTLWKAGGWPLIMEDEEWDEGIYKWQSIDDYYAYIAGLNTFHDLQVDEYSGDTLWHFSRDIIISTPHLPPSVDKLLGWLYDEDDDDEDEFRLYKKTFKGVNRKLTNRKKTSKQIKRRTERATLEKPNIIKDRIADDINPKFHIKFVNTDTDLYFSDSDNEGTNINGYDSDNTNSNEAEINENQKEENSSDYNEKDEDGSGSSNESETDEESSGSGDYNDETDDEDSGSSNDNKTDEESSGSGDYNDENDDEDSGSSNDNKTDEESSGSDNYNDENDDEDSGSSNDSESDEESSGNGDYNNENDDEDGSGDYDDEHGSGSGDYEVEYGSFDYELEYGSGDYEVEDASGDYEVEYGSGDYDDEHGSGSSDYEVEDGSDDSDDDNKARKRVEKGGKVAKFRAKYAEYILNVSMALAEARGVPIPKEKLKKDIADLVKFQINLVMLTYFPEERLETKLEWFQKKYNCLVPVTDNGKINWIRKVQHVFASGGMEINRKAPVVIRSFKYIRNLQVLLDNTPSRTIVNYVHWNFLSKVLKTSTKEMRGWYYGLRNEEVTVRKRSDRCIKEIRSYLGYEYVKKYFSDEIEQAALDMIDNIEKEVEYQIKESTWMDAKTKHSSMDNLLYLKKVIGYPNSYRNSTIMNQYLKGLSVSRSHYENTLSISRYSKRDQLKLMVSKEIPRNTSGLSDDPLTPFAGLFLNIIEITAALFQTPYFDLEQPWYSNFGAMGNIMAHEVSHLFDKRDRVYYNYGGYTEWVPEMEEAYKKRAECFEHQFTKYSVVDNKTGNIHMTDYGIRTENENIADTLGLQVAFKAYQRRQRACKKIDPVLPGLEDFSNEQLLFLSFASVMCGNTEPPGLLRLVMEEDTHSLHPLRVIGSVSNSEDFAKTFNCPQGSPMNPEKKCSIWK